MAIEFFCSCGQKISVPGAMAGKRGTCPGCGAVVTIPHAADAPADLPPAQSPHADPQGFPAALTDDAGPEPARTRPCPYCAERILASLQICPICDEELTADGQARRRSSRLRSASQPIGRGRHEYGVKQRVDASKILAQTFQVLSANFASFILIVLIVLLPLIIYTVYVVESLDSASSMRIKGELEQYVWVQLLATLVLGSIATGAITFGVFQQVRGEQASLGDCLSVGLRCLLPVVGVGIVSGLFIGIACIALCIPGILVMTMVFTATPAVVVERCGVSEAFSRARYLSDGYRWQIFFLLLIFWVMEMVVNMVIETVVGEPGNPLSHGRVLYVRLFWIAITIALRATAAALYYYHLRIAKEGIDAEDLASVFD